MRTGHSDANQPVPCAVTGVFSALFVQSNPNVLQLFVISSLKKKSNNASPPKMATMRAPSNGAGKNVEFLSKLQSVLRRDSAPNGAHEATRTSSSKLKIPPTEAETVVYEGSAPEPRAGSAQNTLMVELLNRKPRFENATKLAPNLLLETNTVRVGVQCQSEEAESKAVLKATKEVSMKKTAGRAIKEVTISDAALRAAFDELELNWESLDCEPPTVTLQGSSSANVDSHQGADDVSTCDPSLFPVTEACLGSETVTDADEEEEISDQMRRQGRHRTRNGPEAQVEGTNSTPLELKEQWTRPATLPETDTCQRSSDPHVEGNMSCRSCRQPSDGGHEAIADVPDSVVPYGDANRGVSEGSNCPCVHSLSDVADAPPSSGDVILDSLSEDRTDASDIMIGELPQNQPHDHVARMDPLDDPKRVPDVQLNELDASSSPLLHQQFDVPPMTDPLLQRWKAECFSLTKDIWAMERRLEEMITCLDESAFPDAILRLRRQLSDEPSDGAHTDEGILRLPVIQLQDFSFERRLQRSLHSCDFYFGVCFSFVLLWWYCEWNTGERVIIRLGWVSAEVAKV